MNTYICTRDGNALEWITREFQPAGELRCWQCEQRLRNGLPLLPEREETPIEAFRKVAWEDDARYTALTQGIEEAKQENRLFNNRRSKVRAEQRRSERRKLERRMRGLKRGGWTDKDAHREHLRRIAAERSRPH